MRGRDGCRVPLPWSGVAPPYGFSPEGVATWLPQPEDWEGHTVQAQSSDPGSMLNLYKAALKLRRDLPELMAAPLTWLPSSSDVLHFARGPRFRCIVNLGSRPVTAETEPILTSAVASESLVIGPDSAAWLLQP